MVSRQSSESQNVFLLLMMKVFFLRESLPKLPHHLISFSSFRKVFSRAFPNLSDRFHFLHPPLPRINSLSLQCFNVSLLSLSRIVQHKPAEQKYSLSYKCSMQHQLCSQFTFAGLTDHMKPLSVSSSCAL